ncbi:MAG: hypothetical protein ACQGVC_01755 [Myxococcota bacterium]
MMVHRRKRRGWWRLWTVLAVLTGGSAYLLHAEITAPERHADGCPVGGAPTLTLTLIDASDRVEPSELAQLSEALRRMAAGADPNTRLSVFTAGGGGDVDLLPVFSGCSQARASGALTGAIYASEEARRFFASVSDWLSELGGVSRPTSPLFEVTERLLYRADVVDAAKKHLILVSDLLQNTPAWSVYPGLQGYRAPGEGALPELLDPPAEWDSVTVLMLQRPEARHLQTKALETLWIELLGHWSKTTPVLRKF